MEFNHYARFEPFVNKLLSVFNRKFKFSIDPFPQDLAANSSCPDFCPQRADVRFVVKTVVAPVSFLVLFSVPNLCFKTRNWFTLRETTLQHGVVMSHFSLIRILKPWPWHWSQERYLTSKTTNLKNNTPTQTAFALVKFCTKRRSCDTRSYYLPS